MTLKLIAPGETLQLEFDWLDWLGTGKTLQDSDWTVTPDALTLAGPDHDTRFAWVTVSGAVLGEIYTLKNEITSSDGEVGVRTFTLRCAPR